MMKNSTKTSTIKASKEDPEIVVIDTKGLFYDLQDFSNQLTNAIKSVDKINYIILILQSYNYRF